VTNALVQRFSDSRIRATPTAFGATEITHMLCHLALERRNLNRRASELGRLPYQGLSGPRSVQLGAELSRRERTTSNYARMPWLNRVEARVLD